MNKIKALYFCVKCFSYIFVKILRSMDWNSFQVNLEEKDGRRLNIRYMKHIGSVELMEFYTSEGSLEVEIIK